MDYLVWTPNRSFCSKELLLKSPVVHGTQRCHRMHRLYSAKNALSIMHSDNTSHHKVPTWRLQSGNLVWWTGDSHGDRVQNKSKMGCPFFWNEVTLFQFRLQPKTMNNKAATCACACRYTCEGEDPWMRMSSIYMAIRIPQVTFKKATTGLRTLVSTLGLHLSPKGSTCHSKRDPSHWNLKNFLKD